MYNARTRPFCCSLNHSWLSDGVYVNCLFSSIFEYFQSNVTHQTVHQDQMAAGHALGTGTLSAGTCALLQYNDQHSFISSSNKHVLGIYYNLLNVT